jgi:hypothetical protein
MDPRSGPTPHDESGGSPEQSDEASTEFGPGARSIDGSGPAPKLHRIGDSLIELFPLSGIIS